MDNKKIARRTGKILMWTVLTPVVLVLLLFVAIYIPPVQKWAVDFAGERLSEEMGWDVSVDRVSLKFPLDLCLGGVRAVERNEGSQYRGEQILNCEELTLDVSLMPLFHGEIVVEKAQLTNTDLNTIDLIDAANVKGHVGELSTRDVSMLLSSGGAVVPEVNLKNSDLQVVIADSIPEDTTESEEPFLRTLDVNKVNFSNVALKLVLPPSAGPTTITTLLGDAHVGCNLDLERGNYYASDLSISDSRLTYDTSIARAESALPLFDSNHISVDSLTVEIDTASYLANGDIYANVRHLSLNERCGAKVNDMSGQFRMNDSKMSVQGLSLTTPNSNLNGDATMDLNAFDEVNPGVFSVTAVGNVAMADILPFAGDNAVRLNKAFGGRTLTLDASATGNMQTLYVDRLVASLPGVIDLNTSGTLTNLADPDGNIGLDMKINARGGDLRAIKDFLPADARNSFNIPRGLNIDGDLSMTDGRIKANTRITAGKSVAKLIADYNTATEAYLIDLDARNFRVDQFVPIGETTLVTGRVYARGQGFNFDSPRTYANADIGLDNVQYGKYYLNDAKATGTLQNHSLGMNIDTDDPRLLAHFTVDGTMTGRGVDAEAVLDLPFADIQALGFSADPLTAHTTHGTMKLSSNFGDQFLVDMTAQGLEVAINEKDSLVTDLFDIFAQTTADTTAITAKTGDFYFDLHSPNNLFRLVEQYQKVGELAREQMKDHALNLDLLKQIMPVAELHADIGRDNPVSKFVALEGYRFNELVANLRTSKEYGIQGGAHIYDFRSDSILVDTIYFDIEQDSTHLALRSGVACRDQEMFPAFTAHVNGNMSPRDANLRLDYFDGNGDQGLDLGLIGVIGEDSVLHLTMYPEQPVIGFTKFKVNADNYIDIHKHNRVFADIYLESTEDDCTVSINANPEETQLQNINAVIKNLNLQQLLTIMPFAPKMTGNVGLGANFVQTEENYGIDGMLTADNFTYDDVPIGDLMSNFRYKPTGEAGHDISALLYQNNSLVATIGGTYNANGDERVDAGIIIQQLPAATANAFIPDQLFALSGDIDGVVRATGPVDSLLFGGMIYPSDLHILSEAYSFDLRVGNEPIKFENSNKTQWKQY